MKFINLLFVGVFLASSSTISCYGTLLEFCESRAEGSLSPLFLSTLQNVFQAQHFIETGTFGGITTIRAAQFFKSAHTIELFEPFYQRNFAKFTPYPNIHAYLGESPRILDHILPSLKLEPCLFFLDAHYSGPGTARSHENTPILSEIRSIKNHMNSAVILIDDLRCCQTKEKIKAQLLINPTETALEGYPTLLELEEEILKIESSYKFIIFGDIALAYPGDAYSHVLISPVLQAMTCSRLFEELPAPSAADLENVLKAEQTIMKARGNEKEGIRLLLSSLEGRQHPVLFTTHYKLWNALISLEEGNFSHALALLQEIQEFGLNHPRIERYIALAKNKLSSNNHE